ncbi:MAG: YajQ family cyclic di-GMP-binding protein [Oceanococcus sp.]
MPSFDIVSEVDKHELTNAVDQAMREMQNRFDFRGVEAEFSLNGVVVTQTAPSDFQLDQMLDILKQRLVARGIDLRSLEVGDVQANIAQARRDVSCKQGIDKPAAKKIIALIKASKLKVTAQINEDKLRITGKKRDELQAVMALLKKDEELELPLQFENFRD